MLTRILIGTGILFIVYYLVCTLALGPISFGVYLALFGAALIALGFLNLRWGDLLWAVRLKKVLLPLVLIGLCGFIALEGVIIRESVKKDREPADYIIVLGAGLRGERMTRTQLSRMAAVLECLQDEKIVVSGGQGRRESITEAEAMRRYLVEAGVSPERILMEDASTNTSENLAFSRELIEADSGLPVSSLKVKIVSSDFHTCRALMLARRKGYGEVTGYGGKTPWLSAPTFYIREALALVKSYLFDH